jgi:hypothetical protein
MPTHAKRATTLVAVLWLLRLLTAAALAIGAYIHADLAATYDPVGVHISQGTLFRIEAGVSALAALMILLIAVRTTWAACAVVLASALGVLLLYRYVDVGALGPLPNMYEPVWFPEKTAAAFAEAAGTLTALAGLLIQTRRSRPRGQAKGTTDS